MRFHIAHRTNYQYSVPVFLEPHTLRMIPRQDEHHRILSDETTITPPPSGSSFCLDAEGNQIQRVWFDGLHSELNILVELVVDTKPFNPYNFLLSNQAESIPFRLNAKRFETLQHYVSMPSDPLVLAASARLAEESGHQTLRFLTLLTEFLYEEIDLLIRDAGHPQPVGTTLSTLKGSCRDVTPVFMDLCRAQGIPSRFVSGYQANPDSVDNKHHLHAWPEVYIPGGGWRGFDPTTGFAVSDQYVALAASTSPAMTLPVEGGFRGEAESDITLEMSVQVE